MAVKPHAQIISQTPNKMVFARGGVQASQGNTAFEEAREAELPKMPRSVMEEAIQVYLPSLFKFYTFKDLYIKPMRNRHRAKLAKAFSMRSPRPVVEVIDSLLYTSNGDTHLAYKLCREDFTYLQYWIRLNFFTKTPLMVTAQCQNPEHVQKVEEGKLSAKSLEIRQEIQELKPQVKDLPEDFEIIRVPIRKAICMTSLQLSGFIKLGETDHVVGITSARHLFNQEINQRIEQGLTAKIGIEGNFDNEVIISLDPDLILISPFKRGGYDALKEMDIPLMPYLGYKEMTPLGQAEWIKFVGLLLGEEKKANEIFASIENRYNELKTMAANVKERPVVFSGELRGGNWYAVGGKSFLAQQFHDAGADYFLKDDKRSGGVYLDYETVYSQAENAQFWRIVNSDEAFSYETLGASDTRYQDFRAFREHGIIYCNIRQHPFYESMPMEPEVVLADLIKAFHPQLLPDYQPVYYKRLP